jgi:TonB family protein
MKTNYKIMKKPEISDEEILKYMDFDSLLAKHQAIAKKSIHQKLKWVIAISILPIAVLLYFAIDTGKKVDNPIIAKGNNNLEELLPIQTLAPQDSQQAEIKKESKLIVTEPSKKKVTKAESIESKKESIKEDVYFEAEPTLGYPHLYNYFNTNLQYPQEALKDSIQGVESVTFIINKKGLPTKVEILNTLGVPFDREVLRLLEKMPVWKPATLNGNPVLSKVSVPFTFRVKTSK